MAARSKKRSRTKRPRIELVMEIGDPPPCLFEDCILGYDMEYKGIKATSVAIVGGDNCPELQLKDGEQAIEDWCKGMQLKVRALKPKKNCGSDCSCDQVEWKWTKWARKNFNDTFKRGDCTYRVRGTVVIRLGVNEGLCSFSDDIV
jgi:hypothetical protein